MNMLGKPGRLPRAYLIMAPTVFATALYRYAPERIPAHMSLLGNVNRWTGRADMIALSIMISFICAVLVWAALIAKYRHGVLLERIVLMLPVAICSLWMVMLLGMASAGPETTNIYADIDWGAGRVIAALLWLGFTLTGLMVDGGSVALVGAASLYLVLTIPSIPDFVRGGLSVLLAFSVYAYASGRYRYQSGKESVS